MEQLVWDAGFMKALESENILVDRKVLDLGLISRRRKGKRKLYFR